MTNLDSFDKEETAATSAISLHREIFKGKDSVTHKVEGSRHSIVESIVDAHIPPKNEALNKKARSISAFPNKNGKVKFSMVSRLGKNIVSKDPKGAMEEYNHLVHHMHPEGATSATYHLKKKQVTLHHPIGKDVRDVKDAVKRNKWKHKVIKGTLDEPEVERFTHPGGGLAVTLVHSPAADPSKGFISSTHVWKNAGK